VFLKLNIDPDDNTDLPASELTWVRKEERRRVWLECYLMDKSKLPLVVFFQKIVFNRFSVCIVMSTASLKQEYLWQYQDATVKSPCKEELWWSFSEVNEEMAPPNDASNPYNYLRRGFDIRQNIRIFSTKKTGSKTSKNLSPAELAEAEDAWNKESLRLAIGLRSWFEACPSAFILNHKSPTFKMTVDTIVKKSQSLFLIFMLNHIYHESIIVLHTGNELSYFHLTLRNYNKQQAASPIELNEASTAQIRRHKRVYALVKSSVDSILLLNHQVRMSNPDFIDFPPLSSHTSFRAGMMYVTLVSNNPSSKFTPEEKGYHLALLGSTLSVLTIISKFHSMAIPMVSALRKNISTLESKWRSAAIAMVESAASDNVSIVHSSNPPSPCPSVHSLSPGHHTLPPEEPTSTNTAPISSMSSDMGSSASSSLSAPYPVVTSALAENSIWTKDFEQHFPAVIEFTQSILKIQELTEEEYAAAEEKKVIEERNDSEEGSGS
jgi:hypothetical protein